MQLLIHAGYTFVDSGYVISAPPHLIDKSRIQ